MMILEQMARWTAGLKYEDIPARVRDRARVQVLNILGAIHSGYHNEKGRLLHDVLLKQAAGGKASVLPTGKTCSPRDAALINASLSMVLDFDDYLLFGHSGHSAVLASLATGQELNASWREVLTAQVAANELSGRLGAYMLLGPLNGQMWAPIHLVGGAAAAGKLLGLSAGQLAHALGLALYEPNFPLWPGFMGSDAKLLTAAWPTMTGMTCASLAGAGLKGAVELLDHPQGLGGSFTYLPLPQMMTGLGRAWVTDTLCCKLVPGCAYLDTSLDALLKILEEREIAPEQVVRIEVAVNIMSLVMNALSRPVLGGGLNPVGINFSIPYSLATALIAGRLTSEEFTEEFLKSQGRGITELACKVTVRHSWEMTAAMLEGFDELLNPMALLREIGLKGMLKAARRMSDNFIESQQLKLGYPNWSFLGRAGPALAGRLARNFRNRPWGTPYTLGDKELTDLSMRFPAEVEIQLADGSRLVERCDEARGTCGCDFTETRTLVEKKYIQEATMHMGAKRAAKALDALKKTRGDEKIGAFFEDCYRP